MASRAIKKDRPQLYAYDNDGRDSWGENGQRHRGPGSVSSRGSIISEKEVPETESVGLKKQVGLVSGVALIVGTMIGSGIFISPKGVAEGSGSVGFSLVNWVLCGVISTLGALCMAELGCLIPKSGAEYPYLRAAFGDMIAFLFAWVTTTLIRPSQTAIMTLTFSEYALVMFWDDGCGESPSMHRKLLTAFVIYGCASTRAAHPSGISASFVHALLRYVPKYTCQMCVIFWGALSYAELGTLIPKSGAEYPYLLDSFGALKAPAQIGRIPAFLFAWMNVMLIRPSSVAIITLACSSYILEPFFEGGPTNDAAVKCLAALVILLLMLINCISVKLATGVQTVFTVVKIIAMIIIILGGFAMLGQVILTWINCYSVKLAARIQVVFTAAKLLALLVIVVGGCVMLARGNTSTLDTGFEGTESSVGVITIALYNGMWAYDGWNNLNYVTEEIINPHKNLPRAIMIGIPLVTILYLLVNISYFSVLTFSELLSSPAVAVTWGRRVLGVMWWIIPFFVACSTFGAANGTFFSAGRLTYVAAREGHMVEILSMIHVKRFTPLPSLVFTCFIALLMIIPGDIASLIDFFSFAVWMFYGATMAALLVLRWTMKDAERPYKVPIVIPIFVLLVSLFLVVAPIVDNPQIEFLYAALFILAGLIFYVPFVHFQKVIPGMGKVTLFLQLLMEVSPPTDESEL